MIGPYRISAFYKSFLLIGAFCLLLATPAGFAGTFEIGSPGGEITFPSLDIDSTGTSAALASTQAEVHVIDATEGLSDPAAGTLRATAIAGMVGVGTGVVSYGVWIILHEGAHAVAVELAGGNVTRFSVVPESMEGGGVRFAATYWEDPSERITQREDGWIDIAPNITGLALGTAGSALWLADALPKSRLARMAFASFQIGASINGGIIGVWSQNPVNDIPKAIQAFELNGEQALLFRTALTTGAVLNLIPALDSILYGLTGRELFRLGEWSASKSEVRVRPLAGPGYFGVGGEF